jgi:MFS family permease
MGVVFASLLGGQFVLTQWLQEEQGLSPLAAGLCFVPNAIASMACSLGNTPLSRRWGHRKTAATGMALVATGGFVAALAVVVESTPLVALGTLLVGAGLGTGAPSGTELIMSSAPTARAGSAAGVNETIVEAAGAVGVGVLGSLLVATSFAPPLAAAGVVAALVAFVVGRAAPCLPSRRT